MRLCIDSSRPGGCIDSSRPGDVCVLILVGHGAFVYIV